MARRRISILSVIALCFLSSGCASLFGTKGSRARSVDTFPAASAAPVRPGAFGASDANAPARDLASSQPGSGRDQHSDVESSTPDGGKSIAAGPLTSPQATGTPVTEGINAPGAVGDEAAPEKGMATATRQPGRADAETALGAISIFDPTAQRGGQDDAINGSDPDLIGGR